MSQFEQNLSEGHVGRQLVRFATPFIISNLLQAFYSMADMVIVGQFSGTLSMSGVNIGGQVTQLINNVVFGLSAAATVLIGQYLGAKDRKSLEETVSTLFSFLLWLGLGLTVITVALREPILRLIQTPEPSFSEASSYLLVTTLGIVFIFGYNALSAVMRGMGDSRRPLYFIAIAAATNVVLDLLFVAVFHWAAFGAALATIMAQALSMLLCALYLRKSGFIFDFAPKSFRMSRDRLKVLLRIGIPMSVQNLLSSMSFLFLTAMVNILDPTAIASAAVGAVGKFNAFGVMPAFAMSSAIAAMCAQNIGAGRQDRAVKTVRIGLALSMGISALVFAFARFFPEVVIRIFADDPALVDAGKQYLDGFSWDYIIVPIFAAYNGLFIGAGHTKFSFFTGLTSALAVRIPVCYLLGMVMGHGLLGVGLGAPLASAVASVMCLVYFRSGHWKRSAILPDSAMIQ